MARAMELLRAEFQPATWEACREYMVSGRSADEVASEMGVSVWTVYSAKSRMLRRLRQELDGMLGMVQFHGFIGNKLSLLVRPEGA